MQLEFCPQCGSLEFIPSLNGKRCKRCAFPGPFAFGSMDKINEARKRARNVNITPPLSRPLTPEQAQSVKELADKLKSLKGKSTGEADFL